MENLLHVLKNTKNNCTNIKLSEIHNFVTDISDTNKDLVCDWDEWAGEEWISILMDKKRIAMVGIKIPIIFVLAEHQEKMQAYELVKKLYKVVIDDFEKEIWYIDLDEYGQSVPELKWHASNDSVDTDSFSTSGFWFATI